MCYTVVLRSRLIDSMGSVKDVALEPPPNDWQECGDDGCPCQLLLSLLYSSTEQNFL